MKTELWMLVIGCAMGVVVTAFLMEARHTRFDNIEARGKVLDAYLDPVTLEDEVRIGIRCEVFKGGPAAIVATGSEPEPTIPECSPLDLLPVDEAAKYAATRESLRAWFEPLMPNVDWDAVEYDDDLASLWQDCRDTQAFRAFCVGYLDREIARWQAHETSVELWNEIAPASRWLQSHGLMTTEVTAALDAYERDVLDLIHSEGFNTELRDDPGSRWDLVGALGNAASPSWDAVAEILRGYQ